MVLQIDKLLNIYILCRLQIQTALNRGLEKCLRDPIISIETPNFFFLVAGSIETPNSYIKILASMPTFLVYKIVKNIFGISPLNI
jgi:hypothetical protein